MDLEFLFNSHRLQMASTVLGLPFFMLRGQLLTVPLSSADELFFSYCF